MSELGHTTLVCLLSKVLNIDITKRQTWNHKPGLRDLTKFREIFKSISNDKISRDIKYIYLKGRYFANIFIHLTLQKIFIYLKLRNKKKSTKIHGETQRNCVKYQAGLLVNPDPWPF